MTTLAYESRNVVSPPMNALGFLNKLFVHPSDSVLQSTGYVHVKAGNREFGFAVESHSAMKPGTVGLNRLQRASLNASQGHEVLVRPVNQEKTIPKAMSVHFELELLSKRAASLSEDDVANQVMKLYVGQSFRKDQQLAVECKGHVLKLTVLSVAEMRPEEDGVGGEVKTEERSEDLRHASLFKASDAIKTIVAVAPKQGLTNLTWKKSLRAGASLFRSSWSFESLGVGGLDEEVSRLFREAFASRMNKTHVAAMGMKHTRGVLLYGPPGTGKTLIARRIGEILQGREPKVVNGPEVLNKYVGASEEKIRELFQDAEEDYAANGENSDLHIIIFDEIDAICKQRGSHSSGTGVHDTIVNQLLSKIDGVKQINNILIIGMTNRKDLIDEALLRPGRMELHIRIGLPDRDGRLAILKIHSKKMRESGYFGDDVDLDDVADRTKNFSGAELEGLIRRAGQLALAENIDMKTGQMKDPHHIPVLCMDHFEQALAITKPAFGVSSEDLSVCMRGDIVNYGEAFRSVMQSVNDQVNLVKQSSSVPLLSVLLTGEHGVGKTAVAARAALDSEIPYVKLVTPGDYVGYSESGKANKIKKVFEDAYKSDMSVIILDNLERLIDYVPLGRRFSNVVLQTLMVMIQNMPQDDDKRLLILATSGDQELLKDVGMFSMFNVVVNVPMLSRADQVHTVFTEMKVGLEGSALDAVVEHVPLPISIRDLQMLIEMAKQKDQNITPDVIDECAESLHLHRDDGDALLKI
eukprot:TRINITY_DN65744_c9_g1_i2.p1 TRINITY_DN65744_c9_g1~~TRINITY_DN65744_c9_g1_i2.p1  ORF type:complete len:788 (+),score=440.37 TRINITY_DN65744_c9_g1_i2:110-2365(+)